MTIPTELRTARMLLRSWRASDAAQLEPILRANHAHLAPWIPARVSTPAPARELAARLDEFAADFTAGCAWRYAAFDLQTGDLLGELDLFARDDVVRVPLLSADRAEIGYWLRRDRTGAGYATEGARAMMSIAKQIPKFAAIEIRCDPRNERSAAVPARLGFERVHRDLGENGGEPLEIWELALDAQARA